MVEPWLIFLSTFQKLKQDLAVEKERRQEVEGKQTSESLTIASLRRELQMEKDQHHNTETRYKGKVAELKAELELQKAKVDELNRWGDSESIVFNLS